MFYCRVYEDVDATADPDRVMFVNGGWLYDNVAVEGVTVLHTREDVRMVYHTTMPGKFSALCMPRSQHDFVALLPPHHAKPHHV